MVAAAALLAIMVSPSIVAQTDDVPTARPPKDVVDEATTNAGTGPSDTPLTDDAAPQEAGPLSPLSAYLGLDPLTGEELPPGKRMALEPAGGEVRKRAGAADPDATIDLVEEGLANIQRGDLLGPFGLAAERPAWLASLQRAAVVVLLLFLVWPASIALGEFFAWLRRRREIDRTAGERRYDRQRMTLRLMAAAALAVAIGLTAWGCSLVPGTITAAAVAVAAAGPIVAGVVALALWGQVLRLDRDQLLITLREVRRDQRELRRDLDDLQRRLGRVGRAESATGV